MTFTRGLQEEVAGRNITVQLVLPAATRTELWDIAGFSLSNLNPQSIMTTDELVDAALSGLDQGEVITLPSVEDATLWDSYDLARQNLLAASQNGKPAVRYSAH